MQRTLVVFGLLLLPPICFGCEVVFIRGDANSDLRVNLSDPILLLSHLFSGAELKCKDAGDANDDGRINISDPIFDLAFLFANGPAPPPPYPEPGLDPTPDDLLCEYYPAPLEYGRIVILWDNVAARPGLHSGWGFSCFVRVGSRDILFDTGPDGVQLLKNMELLLIEPEEIKAVILSHLHGDHIGGLEALLGASRGATFYIPFSFPSSIREKINSAGGLVKDVAEPTRISEKIWSTGAMPGPPEEQSLVIETSVGCILIVGCAHPGLIPIIDRAMEITSQRVYLLLGGFHLFNEREEKIRQIVAQVRQAGVIKVAPCHCTGELAKSLFREEYRENYIEVGAGSIIDFEM